MIEIADKSDHPDASDRNHSAYGDGVEHFKATNFYLAARSFSEALEYWPEDPQAWFALGSCYDEMGKPRKAEHCFRTSLEHSPPEKFPDVCYNLGNSLYDQNDFDAAIELYRQIPDGHPIYEKAQKNLRSARELLEKHQAEQVADDQLPATGYPLRVEMISSTTTFKPQSKARRR